MVALPLFAGVAAFLSTAQVLTIAAGVAGIRMTQAGAIAVVAVAALTAFGFALPFRGLAAPAKGGSAPEPGSRWLSRGLAALAVAGLLWALFTWVQIWVLAWYRSPVGWDELWYHLPAINEWVVRGGVGFHPLDPSLAAASHEVELAGWLNLPMGVEVTGFLLYLLAGGSDRLIDAANLPYWPLAFTGLVVIAGQLGARGVWRWMAGALLVGVPLYLMQGATLYVDAGFGSATIAAIAAALVFVLDRRVPAVWAALLLGMTTGLVLGTKGTGAPFGVVILGVAALAPIVVHGWSGWRRHLTALAMAIGAAVAVGGYWYARNAVHTGNPVYPIQVQLGHKVIIPGYDLTGYDRLDWVVRPVLKPYPPWTRTFVAWLQRDLPVFQPEKGPNYAPAGGLGFVWLLAGFPAAVLVLTRALRRPATGSSPSVLLLAVLGLLLYLATTIPWQARFTFWLHALGLPSIAVVVSDAVRGWRSRIGRLVVAGLAVGVLGVAVWESVATMRFEWRVGRDATAGEIRFKAAVDSLWPGLREAPGFRELLATDHVGRGPWETPAGTLANGLLATPLGRRVEVLPPGADASRLGRLVASGVEWIFWEGRDGESLPYALLSWAEQVHRYERYGEYDFYAVRVARPDPVARSALQ